MTGNTYELFLGDLPGSVVGCWYLQEGEQLSPGPLVTLRANSHAYTLFIAGSDSRLRGGLLQRIVSAEGAQVSPNSRLALLQLLDDTVPAKTHPLPAIAQEQAVFFNEGLHSHPYAPLHTTLVRRSETYRRLYRRWYPLFELRRHVLALCVILSGWLLLQSLAGLLGGTGPIFSLMTRFSFWGLLLALVGFGLLLVCTSFQVVSIERQRRHWRK